MLAENPADVFAVGPGLAAETRRVGGELDRQPMTVDDVVAIDIRHRHFCCWIEVVVRALDFEQVLFEFRKLTGTKQTFAVHHEGRNDLGVSVFLRVNVQHEVDQRTFQSGPKAGQKRKARSCDFGGAFQIEYPEWWAEIPMRLRFEIEPWRGAYATDFDVLIFGQTDRRSWIGQIRNRGNELEHLVFNDPKRVFLFLNLHRDGLHLV